MPTTGQDPELSPPNIFPLRLMLIYTPIPFLVSQVDVFQLCSHHNPGLHGATTQKTAIFVLTAVRTSNPT
jgi:hypothetical protein